MQNRFDDGLERRGLAESGTLLNHLGRIDVIQLILPGVGHLQGQGQVVLRGAVVSQDQGGCRWRGAGGIDGIKRALRIEQGDGLAGEEGIVFEILQDHGPALAPHPIDYGSVLVVVQEQVIKH